MFPTGEEDADPFKSYGAHAGVMSFAPSPLGLIAGSGPAAIADGTAGKLVQRLAQELRASQAEVDASLFAGVLTTGAPDRSDAKQGGNSWAESQRGGSEPKAVTNLGAKAAPAPGRFSKSNRSG